MNATLWCSEPSTSALPSGDLIHLWRAACRSAVGWLRRQQTARTVWRELRQLDERSLSEARVTPGRYWPLDRSIRF